MKYLGINSTKEAKDFYIENYKTLLKEIKKDKWKDVEDLIILKHSYYIG